jgi:hypothetical protein
VELLLLQLDGSRPNIALMRVAAHYRALGWEVELQRPATPAAVERGLFDVPERVYASLIFDRTRPGRREVVTGAAGCRCRRHGMGYEAHT